METSERIGNIIKKARESRGLSLEDIAEKTRIAKKFILAIEKSDFAVFPADIYLYGFIHNICEYLKLDPWEMVERFKKEQETNHYKTAHSPAFVVEESSLKNTEQAADPERVIRDNSQDFSGLEEDPSRKRRRTLVISLSVASILFISLFIFIILRPGSITMQTADGTVEARTYRMINDKESFDLQTGDVIKLYIADRAHIFTLLSISGDNATFTLDDQKYTLSQGGALNNDLDSDSKTDVEIKLKIITGDLGIFLFSLLGNAQTKTDYQSLWNSQEHIILNEKEYVLFKKQDKFPITVYIKAQNQPSFLQYNIDGKRQNSTTLSPGEETAIRAEEHLEVQIGNYRSDIILINNIPVTITSQSESFQVTKIIKWIPDPENETKFDLVIKDSFGN